ncbi:MAG TPA: gas vesicle protein GvpO [Baekduia sp.]|nr:gas vesicle protein GvpO [Baekduia sp.]
MRPAELAQAARAQVAELTGHEPETVTGLNRNGDAGDWVVTVEALELARTPNTMDVLGSYEVELSEDGELLGFRRRRRYHRAAQEED